MSYKNLILGSIVFGYVIVIIGKDIVLVLLNNFIGYVFIIVVFDGFNVCIEKLLVEEEGNEKIEEEEDVDLK